MSKTKNTEPNLPKQMPALLPRNFADLLLDYKQALATTEAASNRAVEAENTKQVAYQMQCDLRDKIIEIWKRHRSICRNSELFRLPDGQLVKLDGNMIIFEKTTNLF